MEDLHSNGDQLTSNESFENNFLNFFPNISVAYKATDLFNFSLSANRRVQYPYMGYLNPFKKYTGVNQYSTGNPNIQPMFANYYNLNLTQYVSVFYSTSSGSATSVGSVVNDSVYISSPINLSSTKLAGFSINLPYYNSPMAPFRLPEFISSININYNYTKQKQEGSYLNENLNYTSKSNYVFASLDLSLWYNISADMFFYYRPKTEDIRNSSNEIKYLSMTLTKSFFNKRIKIRLNFDDILNSSNYESKTYGTDYFSYNKYVYKNSRSISVGITYMFNDYKERRDRDVDDGREMSGDSKGK
jgi:hypothetical protein